MFWFLTKTVLLESFQGGPVRWIYLKAFLKEIKAIIRDLDREFWQLLGVF